jgi:uncharacterized damage-inducible protein DinB
MKNLLASFARYDLWANEKLFAVVLALTESQQQQEIKSSFPSIHKTCSHLMDAYRAWGQRLQKDAQIPGPGQASDFSTEEIVKRILQLNKQWIEWVDTASESDIEAILAYKNIKGDAFQQPVKEILLHLFNHGTYHRGQLVTMFRQVGVEDIPQTDYIFYTRC